MLYIILLNTDKEKEKRTIIEEHKNLSEKTPNQDKKTTSPRE